jgi:small-conductance mechanosensitive channel
MNRLLRLASILSICFPLFGAAPLGPLSSLFNFDPFSSTPHTFAMQVEKSIEALQKKKSEQLQAQAFAKTALEQESTRLAVLKEKVQRLRGNEFEFASQKITILTKIVQVLTELVEVHGTIIATLDAHIRLLQEYKQDPEFKNKDLRIPPKSIYSIDDLQKVTDLSLQYTDKLKDLEERLKKISQDNENLKKIYQLARQEYEEKKKEQRELKSKAPSEDAEKRKFSVKQQGELLDEEEKLLKYKLDLAELRLKETDYKASFIEEQIKITRLQLDIIEKEYEHIKRELRIDKKDIQAAELALKAQIQESTRLQEEYTKRIESLQLLKQNELNQIEQLKKHFNLSDADVEAMNNWTYQPTSIAGWNALIDIGRLANHIAFEIDIPKEYLLAQIDYEKAKIQDQEVTTMIINSWYKITSGKMDRPAHDEIAREIKEYEKIKSDVQTALSAIADKRALATQALNNNARIIENIKARIKNFREQKDTVFKEHNAEYNRYAVHLKDEAIEHAPRRGEFIAQLIELYTKVATLRSSTLKKIDSMLHQLRSTLSWKGSLPFWKGIKNFIPDIEKFIRYLSEQRLSSSISSLQQAFSTWITEASRNPSVLFSFGLQLIIILLVFLLLRLYLPDLTEMLALVTPQYGIAHTISSFAIAVLSFLRNHFIGIFIWSVLFIAIYYHALPDTYLGILFMLVSVPFWFVYAYQFVRYVAHINIQRGYVFASKRYQRRFIFFFSLFLYSTIAIILFRQAFLLAPLPKSQVPTTLLALNFILLQICLMGIIGKEQILNLIPRNTPLWQWAYDLVKKYYYLFLAATIFVIIMSNPYVGYGPQFFYIVSRLLLIFISIPFFSALHSQIKRLSGSFFFYSDGEVIRERFPYARTSYGIFVILSFLFFVALGLIIAANIWGYSIGLRDISDWLHKGLYSFKHPDTGRTIEVNTIRLAEVLLYIVGGIFISYALNRWVLRRMFDLLLVNIGIQNALLSLTRYIIVLAALVIGLQSIGLSSSFLYIFAVLGGLGVAGKEIITDFIGYFIILIQRPIKIGDLVRIDDEVMGVVRHINFRSTLLRRNNSVTVIIPNSHVMTRAVTNWNYSRNFFAFEDIFLTVPYTSDPALVKELILKVLDSNINVLKNPAPIVRLREFTDNGFQFLIRGFLSPDKVLDQFDIASDVRLELVRVLRAHGFDVASPTRILRMVSSKPTDINLPEQNL